MIQIYKYTNKKMVKSEKALGLVEALVSLAVVGTGMVLITSLSLKTLKQARKNELQDIAVQAAVEAMDTMKQPRDIQTNLKSGCSSVIFNFYKVDVQTNTIITEGGTNYQTEISCTNYPNICGPADFFQVDALTTSKYCSQVQLASIAGSNYKYEIRVKVLWETVGGDCEEFILEGYRYGKIIPDKCN
ncbi:hypothetical protein ACFLY9_00185 [Patescibacteria group bacterium]